MGHYHPVAEEQFWSQPEKVSWVPQRLAKVKVPCTLSTSHTQDMMPTKIVNGGLAV